MSETAKHRPLVAHLCGGNGIDIGSAGDPIVPWAVQIELSAERYRAYNSTRPEARLHFHADDAVTNLPFKDGVLDFLHCLPTGTPVLTRAGMKPVETVRIGDEVYGSQGKWRRVVDTYERHHEGELISLRLPGNAFDVKATDGHRVPIIRAGERLLCYMGDVQKGDYVLAPFSSEVVRTASISLMDYLPKNAQYEEVLALRVTGLKIDAIAARTGVPRVTVWQWYTKRKTPWDAFRVENGQIVSGANTHRVPETVPLEADFLRLLGYYIADGCASNAGTWAIAFYFGREETRFRDDVVALMARYFGLTPIDDDSSCKPNLAFARFCSKPVWHLFRALGGEPDKKQIAEQIMKLSPALQQGLLAGLWRGDGDVAKDGGVASYATVSHVLAYQVRELLLRQGWPVGMDYNRTTAAIKGRQVTSTIYRMRVHGAAVRAISVLADKPCVPAKEYRARKQHPAYSIKNDACGLRVAEVMKVPYDGQVYDLTLESDTDRLFMAAGILVHNSSHLLEDFEDWRPVLKEWDRVLKPGGCMIIAVPDHERFRAYVQRGKDAGYDCDNLSHRHESYVDELTKWLLPLQYTVILDRFVNDNSQEYSIVGAFRKNA